jgi:hypothetical protein
MKRWHTNREEGREDPNTVRRMLLCSIKAMRSFSDTAYADGKKLVNMPG